jgi:uncharacterized membrane protein
LERLPLTDAAAAVNGIQEVSGSIPLISVKSLDSFGNQGFFLLLSLVMCDFLRFPPKGKR